MPLKDDTVAPPLISLATVDDVPQLIDIFWTAFEGPGESLFPHTDSGRKWLQRSFDNFLAAKSFYRPESKVVVAQTPNGRPVSFAIVHIARQGQNAVGTSWKTRWSRCDDVKDVSEQKLSAFFEPMAKAHNIVIGKQGHVFIELIITKPSHRNRGFATSLVKWVTSMADDLGFPCYLDAGVQGLGVCERSGFKAQDVEYKYGGPPPCRPMLRAGKD